ncbi:hypothetical protein NA78x_006024 [Anatilimnocola sp. NA78]|uniref:hypothetical protein n=1 Tax=Anatilimnocola sp. NA78 TaxID=3415683 RepID=UPI003CE49837
MIQFGIRDLLGLTAVAAVSCLFGGLLAPRDTMSELGTAAGIGVFGMACYLAGIAVGKSS